MVDIEHGRLAVEVPHRSGEQDAACWTHGMRGAGCLAVKVPHVSGVVRSRTSPCCQSVVRERGVGHQEHSHSAAQERGAGRRLGTREPTWPRFFTREPTPHRRAGAQLRRAVGGGLGIWLWWLRAFGVGDLGARVGTWR
jgi:hypothetical protein